MLVKIPPEGSVVLHPKLGRGVVVGFKAVGYQTLECKFGKKVVSVLWIWAKDRMRLES